MIVGLHKWAKNNERHFMKTIKKRLFVTQGPLLVMQRRLRVKQELLFVKQRLMLITQGCLLVKGIY